MAVFPQVFASFRPAAGTREQPVQPLRTPSGVATATATARGTGVGPLPWPARPLPLLPATRQATANAHAKATTTANHHARRRRLGHARHSARKLRHTGRARPVEQIRSLADPALAQKAIHHMKNCELPDVTITITTRL